MITGVLPVGMAEQSPNADTADEASRLTVEWTAGP
jgi:hypothetical protein